jgi:hypothetical protein
MSAILAMLERLVKAGENLRATAVVDNDFPEMMHNFDSALRAARAAIDSGEFAFDPNVIAEAFSLPPPEARTVDPSPLMISVEIGEENELGLMRGLDGLVRIFNGNRESNVPETFDSYAKVDRDEIRRAVYWLYQKWS